MRSCRGCYVTRRRIYTETDQICNTLTHTSPSRLCIKRYDTTVPFRMFRLLDTSHDEAHYSDSFVPPRRFLRYCSWYIEHAPLNDFQDYLFSYCPVTGCRCIVERRQKGTHSRACGRRSSSDKQMKFGTNARRMACLRSSRSRGTIELPAPRARPPATNRRLTLLIGIFDRSYPQDGISVIEM